MQFIDDAKNVRNRIADKQAFFDEFNRNIAPKLKTVQAAFDIWANQLAYIHPQPNTIIRLVVPASAGYANTYRFHSATSKWGAVAHLLTPAQGNGRTIILFRGTSPSPAVYRDVQGKIRIESTGIPADTDILGVGYVAYCGVAKVIAEWVRSARARGNKVTFVGHSLGGALALRALHAHASAPQHLNAYIYGSAGLDLVTASLMARERASQKGKIAASWHEHDLVAKTGKFPPMRGLEIYSTRHDDFPNLRGASYARGEFDRHLLPFLALTAGWGLTCSFRNKEVPSHHITSEIVRNVVRANPVSAITAGVVSGLIRFRRGRDVHMAGPGLLMNVSQSRVHVPE